MRTFMTWLGIALIAFIAYTYGAKAGRGRYHDIKATTETIWNEPKFAKARKKAVKTATKQAKKLGR